MIFIYQIAGSQTITRDQEVRLVPLLVLKGHG